MRLPVQHLVSGDMERLKGNLSLCRAQVTSYVSESKAIFKTEPNNLTKLHSLLEKVTNINA